MLQCDYDYIRYRQLLGGFTDLQNSFDAHESNLDQNYCSELIMLVQYMRFSFDWQIMGVNQLPKVAILIRYLKKTRKVLIFHYLSSPARVNSVCNRGVPCETALYVTLASSQVGYAF